MKKNIALVMIAICFSTLFAKDSKVSLAGTWRADTVKQGGKRFFASPFILDVGAGGGFELRYSASEKFTQSFFVEAGGGGMIMLKGTAANSKGYASLALGYRTYF